ALGRLVRVHRLARALGGEAAALAIDEPREVVLDERARRRQIRRLPNAQPQRVAAVEAARVPGACLAHLVQRALAGPQLLDQPDVAAIHREPLAERAATDHHGVAAGVLAQPDEALDVDDVAVADDGNVCRDGFAHAPDDV